MDRAVQQAEAGAHILDVNVGLPGLDEPEMMTRVVRAVQSVVSIVPMQIDSSDPAAIEAGPAGRSPAGPSSTPSTPSRRTWRRVLPSGAASYGAAVVGLTMDKGGIPRRQPRGARLELARRDCPDRSAATAFPWRDVLIDCLTLHRGLRPQQDRRRGDPRRRCRAVHEPMGLH